MNHFPKICSVLLCNTSCVPFYLHRYNLCTPESDTDMFIVYQAKTKDILGFNPPKQTIKVTFANGIIIIQRSNLNLKESKC